MMPVPRSLRRASLQVHRRVNVLSGCEDVAMSICSAVFMVFATNSRRNGRIDSTSMPTGQSDTATAMAWRQWDMEKHGPASN